jgi:hypothetical protein
MPLPGASFRGSIRCGRGPWAFDSALRQCTLLWDIVCREDYAVPFYNAIVLQTSDTAEIETYMRYLDVDPAEREEIRRAARQTAQFYLWENVTKNLIQKLEYQAATQGLLARERRIAVRTYGAWRSRTLMPEPAPASKRPVSTPALGVA